MQVHAGSQVAMASVSQLQSSKNARAGGGCGRSEAKHQHVNSEGSLTGRTFRQSNRGVLQR